MYCGCVFFSGNLWVCGWCGGVVASSFFWLWPVPRDRVRKKGKERERERDSKYIYIYINWEKNKV